MKRAGVIPVPSSWTRYSIVDDRSDNGESFTQFFGVPEDSTREDLEEWFTGPAWTSGRDPFGALVIENGSASDDKPCREIGTEESGPKLMWTAILEGTQRDPNDPDSDPNAGPGYATT